MKNKKGFVSMTLVYSFLTIFLFIMAAIIASQTEKSNYVNYVNERVTVDMEDIKGRSTTLMKRMIEDNPVTDGSIYVLGKIADDSHGNGNGLYYLDGGSETEGVLKDSILTDENYDGIGSRIYYYRGQVNNNYVYLKKYNLDNSGSSNYCFRIMRTTEDGSIKMIFYKAATNDTNPCSGDPAPIFGSKFHNLADDNAFVGYTFGKAESKLINGSKPTFHERLEGIYPTHSSYQDTHHFYEHDLERDNENNFKFFGYIDNNLEYNEYDSILKKNIEAWYEENLSQLVNIFTDAMYCIDRTIMNENTGYNQVDTTYSNNVNNNVYSLACKRTDDQIRLSTNGGGSSSDTNALKYPLALPTYMDFIFAGGSNTSGTNNFFLNMGKDYWTMSPDKYFNNNAYEYYINSNGSIGSAIVTTEKKVFPVFSIRPDVVVKNGKGTKDSPYLIEVSETVTTEGN